VLDRKVRLVDGMTPRQPVPGTLYDAAERVLCGIGTPADKRSVLAAVPTCPVAGDAALEVVRHATKYGIWRECKR
jgi:hypothetical protein